MQEDPMLGVRVSGAYEELVSEPARMKQLFQRGNSRRQTSSHRMNAVSSRSHAIFQIMIERRRSTSSSVHVSSLNFVDLAGSERIPVAVNYRCHYRGIAKLCISNTAVLEKKRLHLLAVI